MPEVTAEVDVGADVTVDVVFVIGSIKVDDGTMSARCDVNMELVVTKLAFMEIVALTSTVDDVENAEAGCVVVSNAIVVLPVLCTRVCAVERAIFCVGSGKLVVANEFVSIIVVNVGVKFIALKVDCVVVRSVVVATVVVISVFAGVSVELRIVAIFVLSAVVDVCIEVALAVVVSVVVTLAIIVSIVVVTPGDVIVTSVVVAANAAVTSGDVDVTLVEVAADVVVTLVDIVVPSVVVASFVAAVAE